VDLVRLNFEIFVEKIIVEFLNLLIFWHFSQISVISFTLGFSFFLSQDTLKITFQKNLLTEAVLVKALCLSWNLSKEKLSQRITG
jgi:hypothetical protein